MGKLLHFILKIMCSNLSNYFLRFFILATKGFARYLRNTREKVIGTCGPLLNQVNYLSQTLISSLPINKPPLPSLEIMEHCCHHHHHHHHNTVTTVTTVTTITPSPPPLITYFFLDLLSRFLSPRIPPSPTPATHTQPSHHHHLTTALDPNHNNHHHNIFFNKINIKIQIKKEEKDRKTYFHSRSCKKTK